MAQQMKLNGKEKQALAFFAAVNDNFFKHNETLKARLKAQSKTAWRDWRCAHVMVQRLQTILIDSLTDSDCQWLSRLLKESKVGIDFPGPCFKPDYVVIDARDIADLARMAASEKCTMCACVGRDVKRCRFRELLLNVAPLNEIKEFNGVCEYAAIPWEAGDFKPRY